MQEGGAEPTKPLDLPEPKNPRTILMERDFSSLVLPINLIGFRNGKIPAPDILN